MAPIAQAPRAAVPIPATDKPTPVNFPVLPFTWLIPVAVRLLRPSNLMTSPSIVAAVTVASGARPSTRSATPRRATPAHRRTHCCTCISFLTDARSRLVRTHEARGMGDPPASGLPGVAHHGRPHDLHQRTELS